MTSNQEELWDGGIHLAKYIVEKDFQGALEIHEKDDLVGYALIGIVEAMEKYDATKGVRFRTFACKKAKQRIIDFVRQKRNQHIASINEITDIEKKIRRIFK